MTATVYGDPQIFEETDMQVVINPGSGPVEDADERDASANIRHFATDLALRGHTVEFSYHTEDVGDGRWEYRLVVDGEYHEVEMPGLPLHQVRFIGTPDQNPWDFPRLYVDGSSWLWEYALGACVPE
ncbi:MAG TPA: hypothetical protein VIG24_07555 [Acidimicrobiia bacterium]